MFVDNVIDVQTSLIKGENTTQTQHISMLVLRQAVYEELSVLWLAQCNFLSLCAKTIIICLT